MLEDAEVWRAAVEVLVDPADLPSCALGVANPLDAHPELALGRG